MPKVVQRRSFDLALIDPPWPKRKGGIRKTNPNQTRELDYKTMSLDEIFSLLDQEVFCRLRFPSSVFLWGIDQFLFEGEQMMLRRGYKLHARIIWDKIRGIAPAFTLRYSHEYLSWFYQSPMPSIAIESRGKLRTVMAEQSREHSRKPECMYQAIQTWYPLAEKLDVFSRQQRVGWTAYGNQVGYFNA